MIGNWMLVFQCILCSLTIFCCGFTFETRKSSMRVWQIRAPPTLVVRSLSGPGGRLRAEEMGYPQSSVKQLWRWQWLKFIPNAITVARLLIVPAFVGAISLGKQRIGLVLYSLSCATDWIDGSLARQMGVTSDFGAFLDPVADKIMVSSALVMLVARFPTALVAVPSIAIISRELLVSALREHMAGRKVRHLVKVGRLGKIKTAAQMMATVLLLAVVPDKSGLFDTCAALGVPKVPMFTMGVGLLYVSAVLAWVSGLQYCAAALRPSAPALHATEANEGMQL